jgi:hypothetical protein
VEVLQAELKQTVEKDFAKANRYGQNDLEHNACFANMVSETPSEISLVFRSARAQRSSFLDLERDHIMLSRNK